MFYIASTRFNTSTYSENIKYRNNNNEQVIYGLEFRIRDIYPSGALIFVAEMNNITNKTEGIGLIRNSLVLDTKHKIYENCEYNRYIYRGNYWIGREDLNSLDPEIIDIFDNILFKGKSHMKFRTGITILTEKLFIHWIYELSLLKKKVKTAFLKYFNNTEQITELVTELVTEGVKTQVVNINCDKVEKTIEATEEIIEIVPKKRKRLNKEINK